ncbi:hypothetical protein MNV49_000795 [Pseudohyphozyma bogoriensis]|nr:hypothetical protein MNV49_000795 [Pseudohyphozyma bogoriensis]
MGMDRFHIKAQLRTQLDEEGGVTGSGYEVTEFVAHEFHDDPTRDDDDDDEATSLGSSDEDEDEDGLRTPPIGTRILSLDELPTLPSSSSFPSPSSSPPRPSQPTISPLALLAALSSLEIPTHKQPKRKRPRLSESEEEGRKDEYENWRTVLGLRRPLESWSTAPEWEFSTWVKEEEEGKALEGGEDDDEPEIPLVKVVKRRPGRKRDPNSPRPATRFSLRNRTKSGNSGAEKLMLVDEEEKAEVGSEGRRDGIVEAAAFASREEESEEEPLLVTVVEKAVQKGELGRGKVRRTGSVSSRTARAMKRAMTPVWENDERIDDDDDVHPAEPRLDEEKLEEEEMAGGEGSSSDEEVALSLLSLSNSLSASSPVEEKNEAVQERERGGMRAVDGEGLKELEDKTECSGLAEPGTPPSTTVKLESALQPSSSPFDWTPAPQVDEKPFVVPSRRRSRSPSKLLNPLPLHEHRLESPSPPPSPDAVFFHAGSPSSIRLDSATPQRTITSGSETPPRSERSSLEFKPRLGARQPKRRTVNQLAVATASKSVEWSAGSEKKVEVKVDVLKEREEVKELRKMLVRDNGRGMEPIDPMYTTEKLEAHVAYLNTTGHSIILPIPYLSLLTHRPRRDLLPQPFLHVSPLAPQPVLPYPARIIDSAAYVYGRRLGGAEMKYLEENHQGLWKFFGCLSAVKKVKELMVEVRKAEKEWDREVERRKMEREKGSLEGGREEEKWWEVEEDRRRYSRKKSPRVEVER